MTEAVQLHANLLDMMDSMAASLQHERLDLEALGCLEQGLLLKRRMLGPEHLDVQKMHRDVVLLYNKHAMEQLAVGASELSLDLLLKAEALTKPGKFLASESLRILTFNNLGCYYRRLRKLKTALKYLEQAASLGATTENVRNLSVTHLNLCAIQSQLGRHDVALEHAQSAIFHAQEELVMGDDDTNAADVLDAQTREEKVMALAIAYHNLAVELEFTHRGASSLQWYKKAMQMAFKYKDANADLWKTFKTSLDAAKRKHSDVDRPTAPKPLEKATYTRNHRRHVSTTADAAPTYKPTQPARTGRPATASRKRPPPDNPSRRWHDRAPSPPKQPDFAAFLRAKGPDAVAAAASFTAAPPDRTSPPPPYRRRPTSAHIVEPPQHTIRSPPQPQAPPRTLQPSESQQTTITTNLFDSDSDEEVVEVFAAPSPAIRVERVDVRRPQARATLQRQEKSLATALPERVSHIEYLKRLRQSVEMDAARPRDLALQHCRQLEMHRIHDIAARRLQAVFRGHSVRRTLPPRTRTPRLTPKQTLTATQMAWGAPSPARLERRRQHSIRVVQACVRMFLVRRQYLAARQVARDAATRDATLVEAMRQDAQLRAQERRLLDDAKRALAQKEAEARALVAEREAERARADAARQEAEAAQAAAQAQAASFQARLDAMEAQTRQLLALHDVEKARAVRAQQEADKVKALLAQRHAKAKAAEAAHERSKANAAQAEADAVRAAWEAENAQTQAWIAATEADHQRLATEIADPSGPKCASARREHALEFAQHLAAHSPRAKAALIEMQQAEARHLAASVIQGIVKGRSVRATVLPHAKRLAVQQTEVRNAAASVLQGVCKGSAVRSRALQVYARQLSAQFIARCHFRLELDHAARCEDWHHGAVTVQRVFRGYVERRALVQIKRVRSLAAERIQALVRGRQARLYVLALRAGHDAASRKIQHCIRWHRRTARRTGTRRIQAAAVSILQRAWRRHRFAVAGWIDRDERAMARRLALASTERLMAAAAWQLEDASRDAEALAARLAISCIATLRTTWVASAGAALAVDEKTASRLADAVRRDLWRRYKAVEAAATDDQLDMAVRLASAYIEAMHTRIDAVWRDDGDLSARLTDACASHVLETTMRAREGATEIEVEMAGRLAAASWDVVRRQCLDRAESEAAAAQRAVRDVAATFIQAGVRGFLVRRAIQLPKMVVADVDALVVSVVRDCAAIKMQAMARGYLLRRRRAVFERPRALPDESPDWGEADLMVYEVAATTIQAVFRGYSLRSKAPVANRATKASALGDTDAPEPEPALEVSPRPPAHLVELFDTVNLEASPCSLSPMELALKADLHGASGVRPSDPVAKLTKTNDPGPDTPAALAEVVHATVAECIHSALTSFFAETGSVLGSPRTVDRCVADAVHEWRADATRLQPSPAPMTASLHASLSALLEPVACHSEPAVSHMKCVVAALAASCVNAALASATHAAQSGAPLQALVKEATTASVQQALAVYKEHATTDAVGAVAASAIQALVRGFLIRRRKQLSVAGFIDQHVAREAAAHEAMALLRDTDDVEAMQHMAASVLQEAFRYYRARGRSQLPHSTSGTKLQLPLVAVVATSPGRPAAMEDPPEVTTSCKTAQDAGDSDAASSHLSQQYSQSSFASEPVVSANPSAESLASEPPSSSSQASFASADIPYSPSQASIASSESAVDVTMKTLALPQTLLARLPPVLRTVYDRFAPTPLPPAVDPYEVLARGLPFDAHVDSLTTAYDDAGVLAAADALRAVTHVDASVKTQSNFDFLVRALAAKATDDPDLWTTDVQRACAGLLREFITT
ncbi:hypothetical protein ACHHYP_16144 [Achlya hypogyna]|uniref:Uncharacterized protein n=1 Tax=Achlya hypogyna TaxID=1202772 RepID=A0A1V9Y9I1_ACHHY|nr:hypothetical protein ACHHYP_16144 [Achlya hypogyna]